MTFFTKPFDVGNPIGDAPFQFDGGLATDMLNAWRCALSVIEAKLRGVTNKKGAEEDIE